MAWCENLIVAIPRLNAAIAPAISASLVAQPRLGRKLASIQIAAAMCISVVTVRVHRCQAMRKMRTRSFADLVLLAQTLGLALLPSKSEADEQPAIRLQPRQLSAATIA